MTAPGSEPEPEGSRRPTTADAAYVLQIERIDGEFSPGVTVASAKNKIPPRHTTLPGGQALPMGFWYELLDSQGVLYRGAGRDPFGVFYEFILPASTESDDSQRRLQSRPTGRRSVTLQLLVPAREALLANRLRIFSGDVTEAEGLSAGEPVFDRELDILGQIREEGPQ